MSMSKNGKARVFATIAKGYRLQFAAKPQSFNDVVLAAKALESLPHSDA